MNSKQKRICLIYSSYVGGFKSFATTISNLLVSLGYKITILTFSNQDPQIPNVDVRYGKITTIKRRRIFYLHRVAMRMIDEMHKVLGIHNRKWMLRSMLFNIQYEAANKANRCVTTFDLRSYDCVLSLEEIIGNYILANNVMAKRKIGYIHPNYKAAHFDKRIDRYFLEKLDYICVTSKANAKSLANSIPSIKKKIIALPNPALVKEITKKSNEYSVEPFDNSVLNIITVCRLDNSSKALDRLLMLADKMNKNNYQYVWRIIGEGEYCDDMLDFIVKNSLQNKVLLIGKKENPFPYVKQSDLFVLQSYYEGYPMSVNESLVLNTPVLVTNYPSSSEQVNNCVNGFIVNNDFESIYNKLTWIIDNKNVLLQLKNNLANEDKSHFSNIDALLEVIHDND